MLNLIISIGIAALLLYLAIQIYIRKGIVERVSRTSFSTDPGTLKPKRALLRDLSPGLYPHTLSWKLHREQLRIRIFIARQLWFADSNPAVVVHENPFIMAAYAADCDAVLLVRFLPESVEELRRRRVVLRLGARLLSINTFFPPGEEWKGDEIELGPRQTHRWSSFRPFIAEFMCDDMQTIERRKAEFPPELWERTKQLGLAAVQKADLDQVRWGNPMYVEKPGSYRIAIAHAKEWNMEY